MEEKKPRFFDFEKVNETLKEEKPKVDNTFNKVFNTIKKKLHQLLNKYFILV